MAMHITGVFFTDPDSTNWDLFSPGGETWGYHSHDCWVDRSLCEYWIFAVGEDRPDGTWQMRQRRVDRRTAERIALLCRERWQREHHRAAN